LRQKANQPALKARFSARMKICDTFGGDESLSINKTTDGRIYLLTPRLLVTEDFSPVTRHGEPVFLLRDG
jgi:hypothetical protein